MSANAIYILGAGATRAVSAKLNFPSPLASDFFKEKYLSKFSVPDNTEKFEKTKLFKIVQHYFGKQQNINIEEIYSFIEFTENDFSSNFLEKINFQRAKYELLEYLYNILIHEVEYNSLYYEKIIDNLKDGDSIITFNWDLVFDEVLSKSMKGNKILKSLKDILNPINTFENSDYDELAYNNYHKSYFLKLHGSLNWGICTNRDCLRNQIPFVYDLGKEIYPSFWNCNCCGGKIETMLMPPHVHKNFRTHRVFKLQSKIAYDKIRTAEKIIIIGYSFPEFDFEVSSLFRKAKLEIDEYNVSDLFLKELHVIDPATKYTVFNNKIKDIFGLNQSIQSYGNKVKFYKYLNIDEFIEKQF